MTDDANTLAQSQTAEAANASAVSKEADMKAHAAQVEAAVAAAFKDTETRLANTVAVTMKEAFRFAFTTNDGEQRKFVDVTQLHRICDDIERQRKATDKISEKIEKWDSDRVTKDDIQGISKIGGDHETRLRTIEKNMWKWIGVLLIIPPIMTILIAWILSMLIHK